MSRRTYVVKDVITFDPGVVPPGAPATIQQVSTGTTTVSNVTIDGTGAGVIWRGVDPGLAECISFDGSDITIRNMQFTRCAYAVWMLGGSNITLGPGLVVSNSTVGIKIQRGSYMNIIGNRIGTNAAGTAVNPNGGNTYGVHVENADHVAIGGPNAADRNVIAGNSEGVVLAGFSFDGLNYMSTSNSVVNNYIGTDVTGTVQIDNNIGVRVGPWATGNTIGAVGQGNLISGNTSYNVRIQGPLESGTTVAGNKIGVNANGVAGSMVSPSGVSVALGASGNTIGPGNVISNVSGGVYLRDAGTTSNVVKGNLMGIGTNGAPVPNYHGVLVSDGASGNMIGGTGAGDGNVIANNNGFGVRIDGLNATTAQNSVRGNSIYANGSLLQPDEQIDNANGGNMNPPWPYISLSTGLTVQGTACPYCAVDIFSSTVNHPQFFEGTTTAGPGGNFTFTSSMPFAGQYVIATATDIDGNTSETGNWIIADQDGDGFNDAIDPDDDNDGVLDTADLCRYTLEDTDGFQDGDGCPDPDNDGDGICDVGQASPGCSGADSGQNCFDPAGTLACSVHDCRNTAEDIDAFKDGDGCPEPDNDNDSFPDATDACPGADASAGPNGMFGAAQDLNHNGVQDGAEAALTTDDVMPLLMWEDKDGVLDTDGCHDSPGDDFDGDGFTDDAEVFTHLTDAGNPDTDADTVIDAPTTVRTGQHTAEPAGVDDSSERATAMDSRWRGSSGRGRTPPGTATRIRQPTTKRLTPGPATSTTAA
jgi:hypothetical protein